MAMILVIRIAVCEDEQAIRNCIGSFLTKIGEETYHDIKVSFFSAGEFLLKNYKSDYDIILLDIHMGDENLNGMQVAKAIRKLDDKAIIIFLTGLTRYLKEGYKVKAFRYLTKPISYNEFKIEICNAISEICKDSDSYLKIVEKSVYHRIELNDIYYIETSGRKVLIHTKSGDIDATYAISYFTDVLEDKNFYRCHNSYLINLLFVEKLESKFVYVHGEKLPVSRQRVKELKTKLSDMMGKFL